MELTLRTDKIAVYDSVLSAGDFENAWVHVQNEKYSAPAKAGAWIKVWRLNDGPSVSSAEYLYSKRPFGNAYDPIFAAVAEAAKAQGQLVGHEGREWHDIALRSYLYPRGTKLSWHDDTDLKAGSFIFYAHPRWGSTWGGELLVAETGSPKQARAGVRTLPYVDHAWEDRFLLEAGHGHFVSAKPNRLVLLSAAAYHSIGRVDPDAGDNVRCSVSGFFIARNAGGTPRA